MSSHSDADAFLRAILNDPAEVTSRLAFADWLEETDVPSNADWGSYIRLMTEADTHPPGSFEHDNCRWRAANLPTGISATLELDADLVVTHTQSLLRLLPANRFRVVLSGFTPPPAALEAVSPMFAFFSRVFPLALLGHRLLVAVRDPESWEALGSLRYSLGHELIAVGAEIGELAHAIGQHYGRLDAEDLRGFLVHFLETTPEFRLPPPPPRPPVPDPPFFRLDLGPGT